MALWVVLALMCIYEHIVYVVEGTVDGHRVASFLSRHSYVLIVIEHTARTIRLSLWVAVPRIYSDFYFFGCHC